MIFQCLTASSWEHLCKRSIHVQATVQENREELVDENISSNPGKAGWTLLREGRLFGIVRNRRDAAARTRTGDIAHATPVIDNERVKVWDITLAQGQSTAFGRHENDFVTMFLVGASFRSTNENGGATVPSVDSVKRSMATRERNNGMRSFPEGPARVDRC